MRDDLNKIADELKIDTKEYAGLLNFTKNMFKVKSPDDMLDTSKKGGLKKTLGTFDLIMLGIGVMIYSLRNSGSRRKRNPWCGPCGYCINGFSLFCLHIFSNVLRGICNNDTCCRLCLRLHLRHNG